MWGENTQSIRGAYTNGPAAETSDHPHGSASLANERGGGKKNEPADRAVNLKQPKTPPPPQNNKTPKPKTKKQGKREESKGKNQERRKSHWASPRAQPIQLLRFIRKKGRNKVNLIKKKKKKKTNNSTPNQSHTKGP